MQQYLYIPAVYIMARLGMTEGGTSVLVVVVVNAGFQISHLLGEPVHCFHQAVHSRDENSVAICAHDGRLCHPDGCKAAGSSTLERYVFVFLIYEGCDFHAPTAQVATST